MGHKGFVDLQVNGYLGVDFSSPELQSEDIGRITEALVRAGTIGYLATVITSEMDVYRRNLPLLARAMEQPGVREHLLGIHMEGPYLSGEEGARGAHYASRMRRPDSDEFDRFQEWAQGQIALLTLAPEREGALGLIGHVSCKYKTRVSLGHHLADRETIQSAANAGASLITHLGNGCPSMLPRHDNILIHQLANDSLTAGLITDGHHLPADFIRIALRCKSPERVFVVSDMAPIAGFEPGIYETLGNTVRLTATGRIENVETPYFAGSGCTMVQCMRFLRSLEVLGEEDLWRVGLKNPLRILGRDLEAPGWSGLPDFQFAVPEG
jgi:N-acetylglucosamine-6-phosphate deacetylase